MSIRIISTGSIEGRPIAESKAQAPYRPTIGPTGRRSSSPEDHREPSHRGGTRKIAVLDPDGAAPSSPFPTRTTHGNGITPIGRLQQSFATLSALSEPSAIT